MKIVCDACQAKYSISDDKVQGKVFKIRCKKCSNIIVVRGGAGAAEAAPAAQEKDTRVYDYGADAGTGAAGGDESVWHVVINQDQVGPMTAAEVQQRFAAGEIDAETYAWREGFADWLPLSQVDAFAAYVASGSTTAAVSNGGGGAAAVSAMFGGGGGDEAGTVRSDPGDLFSAASASSASSGGGDEDGDLFGRSPRAAAGGGGSAAANSKLRGERNENSVLFSLNNLAQLASDKPAPSASVVSTPSGHATGAAGGEGSGLIDIRSMANAYLGNSGGGTAKPAASIGTIDDLPVFGGGGFSEPAVIVPTAGRQQNNKMMYVLIGSVGFLAVAAVIMIVVMLQGGKDSDGGKNEGSQVAVNDKGSGEEGKTPEGKTSETGTGTDGKTPETKTPETGTGTDGKTPETKTPETGTGTDGKTPEAKTPETKEPETKRPEAKKPDTKRPETKKPPGGTTVAAKTPEPRTPPSQKEPAGGGGCDEVSCVLNNYEGACCAKFKKGPKPTNTAAKPATGGGGGGDLPESLDRTMIQDGVNKVKTRVMGCGDKSSAKGQVKVSVKVSPAGGVSNVSVKSSPDAALGSCVASAMQKATFGKTQNGGSFAYPWNF